MCVCECVRKEQVRKKETDGIKLKKRKNTLIHFYLAIRTQVGAMRDEKGKQRRSWRRRKTPRRFMIKLNFWQKLLLYCIYIHLSSFLFPQISRVLFLLPDERKFFSFRWVHIFCCCCFFSGEKFIRRKEKIKYFSYHYANILGEHFPLFFVLLRVSFFHFEMNENGEWARNSFSWFYF